MEIELTVTNANSYCPSHIGGAIGNEEIRAEWGQTVRLCVAVFNDGTENAHLPVVDIFANGSRITISPNQLVGDARRSRVLL